MCTRLPSPTPPLPIIDPYSSARFTTSFSMSLSVRRLMVKVKVKVLSFITRFIMRLPNSRLEIVTFLFSSVCCSRPLYRWPGWKSYPPQRVSSSSKNRTKYPEGQSRLCCIHRPSITKWPFWRIALVFIFSVFSLYHWVYCSSHLSLCTCGLGLKWAIWPVLQAKSNRIRCWDYWWNTSWTFIFLTLYLI